MPFQGTRLQFCLRIKGLYSVQHGAREDIPRKMLIESWLSLLQKPTTENLWKQCRKEYEMQSKIKFHEGSLEQNKRYAVHMICGKLGSKSEAKETRDAFTYLIYCNYVRSYYTHTHTHTHTTILRLYGFCPGQPVWACTRRNIHPLTPIVVITHPLSASSIYYDPWHPPCSVHAPDNLFPQSVSRFSLNSGSIAHWPHHVLSTDESDSSQWDKCCDSAGWLRLGHLACKKAMPHTAKESVLNKWRKTSWLWVTNIEQENNS